MVSLKAHVLILGAGPAGAATALALQSRNISTIVVERGDFSDFRVGEHLAPDAMRPLLDLGVLDRVTTAGHQHCPGVCSAWGSTELTARDYIFHSLGEGLHLSRNRFDADLAATAQERGAQVLRRSRCFGLEWSTSGWSAMVETKQDRLTIASRFAVDATGRSAWLARSEGFYRHVHDKLVGMTALLEPRMGSVDHSLLVEAAEDGWFYSALLESGQLLVSYLTDADLRDSSVPARELWVSRLRGAPHTAARAEAFVPPTRVYMRAAESALLESSAGRCWLAVGDAAQSFDPLSSSGIAHSLQNGIDAAAAIDASLGGDAMSLRAYAAARRRAYASYLIKRSLYYRMERRWLNGSFWRRRHRLVAEHVPVTIHPYQRLSPGPHPMTDTLTDLLDKIDVEVLCQLCSHRPYAHEAVAGYRQRRSAATSDREVIVALQVLLDRGVLSCADGQI